MKTVRGSRKSIKKLDLQLIKLLQGLTFKIYFYAFIYLVLVF